MHDVKVVSKPIALNIVGGLLAEEGSPVVFIPLDHRLRTLVRYGNARIVLGEKMKKLVNYRRLRAVYNSLTKYSDHTIEIVVEDPPITLTSLCYESAIFASLADFLNLDADLTQFLIEEKIKGAERGLLAGATICSLLQRPIAYRVEEGFVEFNNGIRDLRVYIFGYNKQVSLGDILSKIRRLKMDYAEVYEPLFHTIARLSIEVIDSLRSGDLYSLSKLLRISHKILSAAEVTEKRMDYLALELETKGLWGKLLEDIGQYIFTLTDHQINLNHAKWLADLEVYGFHVL